MKKEILFLIVIALGITFLNAQPQKTGLSYYDAKHSKMVGIELEKSAISAQLSTEKVFENRIDITEKNEHFTQLSSNQKKALKHTNKVLSNYQLSTPLLIMNATKDTTFYEGFESYDGIAKDWIPSNWTEITKTSTNYVTGDSINPTWAVRKSNRYTRPSKGNSMAWIDYNHTNNLQDEWLISSAFTPASGDYINFDFFFYCTI